MKNETHFDVKILSRKIEALIKAESITINAPMSKYTSFKAGGFADIMVVVESISEIKELLNLLYEENIHHIFLGSGTNILVKDGGYRGVVIKQGDWFSRIETEGESVTAFAGAKISSVAKAAMEKGLSGLEFAGGIPGSIGGGVFMNAGAYGGEMKDVLISAKAVSRDGSREYEISAKDMELGYRHSIFHDNKDVIISGVFGLKQGEKSEISATMKELNERRNKRQPVNLPSAGSFFKRPEGHFAGKLIEDAGLKGLSVGDAQVSPLHSGFIVNNKNASVKDILQLMKLVQNTVFDKFGVMLEPEVRILGED